MQIIPVLKSPLTKRDSVSAAPSEATVRVGQMLPRINNLKMFLLKIINQKMNLDFKPYPDGQVVNQ